MGRTGRSFDNLTKDELREQLQVVDAKLRENQAIFESIVEDTLAGYWIWNIVEDSMFISPHLKRMLGYEDSELPNSSETINKLMHPSDLPDTYSLLGKHIESNGAIPFEIEVRYKHKNGDILWVICTGRIVKRDKDGKPLVMIGCHVDNTELKKSQDIQKYVTELEQKNKEMEQFAYVASHDLQEPLNTIQGFVGLMSIKLRDNPDEEVIKYLEYINKGTLRMSSLIKGLLEYSRIGKETNMSMLECNELVKQVREDLDQSIKDVGAVIEIDNLPGIMGYEVEFRILFQNLISNALKFRDADSPLIKIGCSRVGDYWKFSIADNGIGIEPEFRQRIFQLYQRLHPKSEFEGNGLGLAQCHKIVTELHNGKIWVESNEGKGSVFNFTIPVGI